MEFSNYISFKLIQFEKFLILKPNKIQFCAFKIKKCSCQDEDFTKEYTSTKYKVAIYN